MGFIFPSQNRPKCEFSVGVIKPKGIAIPMGFIFLSKNRQKSDFLVGVINPKGITILKGIDDLK